MLLLTTLLQVQPWSDGGCPDEHARPTLPCSAEREVGSTVEMDAKRQQVQPGLARLLSPTPPSHLGRLMRAARCAGTRMHLCYYTVEQSRQRVESTPRIGA